MNEENLELWLRELESGKHGQTKNVLTRVHESGQQEHCCLGVGCVVAGIEGEIDQDHDEHDFDFIRYGDELMYGDQPEEFNAWLGLPPGVMRLADEGAVMMEWESAADENLVSAPSRSTLVKGSPLTMLNDTAEMTFPEIAAAIRLHGLRVEA